MEFPDISGLLTLFLSLGGVSAFVAVVVNILKTLGVIKDGYASVWSTGLNMLGLIALFVMKLFPGVDIAGVDSVINTIAQILSLLFGLIVQLLGSKLAHFAIKGFPVLGTSYSLNRLKDLPKG